MCTRGVVIYSHVHKRRGYIQSCAQEAWLYTVMCTRGVVIYSHVCKRRGHIQSCAQEAWSYTVMCARGVVIYSHVRKRRGYILVFHQLSSQGSSAGWVESHLSQIFLCAAENVVTDRQTDRMTKQLL